MSTTGGGGFPGATVVMYGTGGDGFRFPDVCPRCGQMKHYGDCWIAGAPVPDLGQLFTPLVTCSACKRHIVRDTECPFCFAANLAKRVRGTKPNENVKFPVKK